MNVPGTDAALPETASQTELLFEKARKELYASSPVRDARLGRAAQALEDGDVEQAKRIVSGVLSRLPDDPDALSIMAEIACCTDRDDEAEPILERCVAASPHNKAWRYDYVLLLARLGKVDEALAQTQRLLESEPDNLLFRNSQAALLGQAKRFAEASAVYRRLTNDYPDCPEIWCSLASTFRSQPGHTQDAVDAFRRATELAPWMGSVWWSLASMKTFAFSEADVERMEKHLGSAPAAGQHRANMHFALGKGFQDLKNYEKSFRHYFQGNAIRRVDLAYDPQETTDMVTRAKTVFTPKLFAEQSEAGHPSTEPIFVLGLQRAGSTLLEQILGSHSQIESAGELQSLLQVVGDDVMPLTGPDYPNGMDKLSADNLRAFGEKYLELSRKHRKSGRPFFVDKCCFNLWHVGLLHLIFPKAKIVDMRRHPIACCYGNFTMSFAHAPPLSYRLSDIGRFYRDYVRLMAHFDCVLPGKIHRVIYEDLVADTKGVVRRLFDFLALPFEDACLEYYKSDRAFNSFSNEQVRRPIFKDGVEQWRNYEPWLGPLKEALGPVLDAYPGVPEFDS